MRDVQFHAAVGTVLVNDALFVGMVLAGGSRRKRSTGRPNDVSGSARWRTPWPASSTRAQTRRRNLACGPDAVRTMPLPPTSQPKLRAVVLDRGITAIMWGKKRD